MKQLNICLNLFHINFFCGNQGTLFFIIIGFTMQANFKRIGGTETIPGGKAQDLAGPASVAHSRLPLSGKLMPNLAGSLEERNAIAPNKLPLEAGRSLPSPSMDQVSAKSSRHSNAGSFGPSDFLNINFAGQQSSADRTG